MNGPIHPPNSGDEGGRRPLASVVTPVYRTPLPLFEEAFQSLLAQTCGFDRIEWLVGIHNMDDAYEAALRRITGDRENVVFLRVEGGHSPSVPRNRCLDHASGDYVFFLDSDDRMAGDCIEKATAAMETSGAEIAVFGSELIMESDRPVASGYFDFLAPTGDLTLYERGDPRTVSLMMGNGGMLWSRAYLRSFLERTGVHFADDISIGEDLLFNLAVTPLAECVCAMPQLKGCYHRVWSGSLIESKLSSDALLRFLPEAQKYGATELLWHHLGWFVNEAMHGRLSPQLRASLAPVLGGLRVVTPRPSGETDRMEGMLAFSTSVLSLPVAPRLRQRHETLPTPLSEEEVQLRVAAAARENPQLRTTGTKAPLNPYLGVTSPEARPEVCVLDIRQMPPERQTAHMDSYRRVELLRGFRDGEVRCRVTVFRLSPLHCALSFCWDDRFIGDESIVRLRDRVCGDMGKYAPAYPSVSEMLRRQALMDPKARVFSYWNGNGLSVVERGELAEQMDALAAFLASERLRTMRVAVAAPNSYAWVLLYLTLLREGMTLVAVDPALGQEELTRRLRQTDAAAVFLADGAEELRLEGVRCFRLSELPAMVEKGKALPRPGAKQIAPEREALIVFTSGTTGYGKAAVITQGNLTAYAHCPLSQERFERSALILPLYHIYSQHVLMSCLYSGGETLISTADPVELTRAFCAFRPQFTAAVPRTILMLQTMIMGKGKNALETILGDSLKRVLVSGAPMQESVFHALCALGIFAGNLYGSTETSGIAQTDAELLQGRHLSILPGVEVRLAPDREILVRSPMVFAGYLDDSAATAQVLDADGWFHTGDLGVLNPDDGTLALTGRLKNLILFSNGKNVSPEELEDRLSTCPLIEECLVFGDAEETIAAKIYPTEAARQMEPDALEKALWEQISALNGANPRFMRIGKLYVGSAPLERNSMGKLKRPSRQ